MHIKYAYLNKYGDFAMAGTPLGHKSNLLQSLKHSSFEQNVLYLLPTDLI